MARLQPAIMSDLNFYAMLLLESNTIQQAWKTKPRNYRKRRRSVFSPMMRMHEPSRGIGRVAERSRDRPTSFVAFSCGQTASRKAARRVILPGWGRTSNITEDVRSMRRSRGLQKRLQLKPVWTTRPTNLSKEDLKSTRLQRSSILLMSMTGLPAIIRSNSSDSFVYS